MTRQPDLFHTITDDEADVLARASEILKRRLTGRQLLHSFDLVEQYLLTKIAPLGCEVFQVLFLDRRNTLISDEAMARGTIDHVPVYPREIIKRAFDLNATALILAHNHPSGNPSPSEDDLVMTGQVVRACEAVGITVHDHLIVGGTRTYSLRSAGQM